MSNDEAGCVLGADSFTLMTVIARHRFRCLGDVLLISTNRLHFRTILPSLDMGGRSHMVVWV